MEVLSKSKKYLAMLLSGLVLVGLVGCGTAKRQAQALVQNRIRRSSQKQEAK